MPVYVDDMFMEASVPNGGRTVTGRWCHLTADTDAELHAVAAAIGLRRAWFQPPKIAPDTPRNRERGIVGKELTRGHYDVVGSKRAAAIRAGAIPVRWGCEPWRDKVRKTWDAVLGEIPPPDVRPVAPGEEVVV